VQAALARLSQVAGISVLNPNTPPPTGSPTPSQLLRQLHMALGVLAYSLALVFTALWGRYWKAATPRGWFPVHAVLGTVSVGAAVGCFAAGLAYVGSTGAGHFSSAGNGHTYAGIVLLVFTAAQPLLGLVARARYDPARQEAPWLTDRLHWILGFVTLTLGYAVQWLGLALYCVNTLTGIAFGFGLLLSALSFVAQEWLARTGGFGAIGHYLLVADYGMLLRIFSLA
jgi:hypothetical protein